VTGDAREGGRVSAALVQAGGEKPRAAVAFLAETPSRLVARLHVEGAPAVLTLTPEGSEATTTALAALESGAHRDHPGSAHRHEHGARATDRDPGDALTPGDDVVVWVGGSAQGGHRGRGARRIRRRQLGLHGDRARRDPLRAGPDPRRQGPRPRAGGLLARLPERVDPAPVATGSVCGQTVVLYARPSAPAPHSPQELHAAAMGPGGLGPSRVVASAPAFANVSIATLPNGALIGYVAEGRTWAATIRCPVR
jgi:hypothetical protein